MARQEKIDEVAVVVGSGAGCRGCVPWETPWIKFQLGDGRLVLWWSERVNEAGLYYARPGVRVRLQAFVRDGNPDHPEAPRHLFRVKAFRVPETEAI